MARPWRQQRGYNFIDSLGVGFPYVELIGTFEGGETVTRSRLDFDARAPSDPANYDSFPDAMQGAQMVVALAFDQDATLPIGPGGFFGYTADWLWVQQVSFEVGAVWEDPIGGIQLAPMWNSVGSQSIDTHAQRAVLPGNEGGLWLVLDMYGWHGPGSRWLAPQCTYTSYVGSKLPL